MTIDASKLLFIQGSTAARHAKVSQVEPTEPSRFDPARILALQGGSDARSVKVGGEPAIRPAPSKLLALKGGEAAKAVKVGTPEPDNH